jgi:hypothetical protein
MSWGLLGTVIIHRTMENILGAIYVGKMVIVHRRCFQGRAGPIPGHSRYSSTRFFLLSSQKLFISFLFSSSNTSREENIINKASPLSAFYV